MKGHLSVILCLLISTVFIKVTPGNFAQLLILHAHIGGSIVALIIFNPYPPDTFWAPLFYCVMPWRTEEVYAKAFELIESAISFPWPADLDVMMDFEM